MVIERTDVSNRWSRPKVENLEAGYEELIYDGFGVRVVLKVNSPDSVSITKAIQEIVLKPQTYECEQINEAIINGDIYWFRGLAALNLLLGKDVKFVWRPESVPAPATT